MAQPSHLPKWLDMSLAGLFIGSIIAIRLEVHALDNTIGGLELFFRSLGLGALLGVACTQVLLKRFATPPLRAFLLVWITFAMAATGGCFTAALASRTNRTWTSTEVKSKTVEVTKRDQAGASNGNMERYLFFQSDRGEERILVPEGFWMHSSVGMSIRLHLKVGALNYPVVVGAEPLP